MKMVKYFLGSLTSDAQKKSSMAIQKGQRNFGNLDTEQISWASESQAKNQTNNPVRA